MASLEKELGLDEFQSDSSYFDYVEQKTQRGTKPRAKVIENQKQEPKRATITENAKYWKEYVSS